MTDFLSQLRRTVSASFDIERELSGGGMSRVFVATERALGRQVVIKVLPPELAAGVNIDRFRREIQLAAQLHHPHIVPLLSTGEGDGILYYTMPYIEGESLRLALERSGRLSVSDVVRILHDVVDALAYAHGRGVIHRDIKPANILRLGSHALVTDFGVAKALSAALPISGVTTAGIAIGTPAYMAPEQLAGDPAADHRLDLYAVGLLAYELLIGESPFSSSSPQATMAAQLTRAPEPLHELRPDVPEELSDLIMRCLEKNPAFRPRTALALQGELDAVSTPRGAVIGSGETVLHGERTSAARGALLGAAVVILGSAAAYAFIVSRDKEPTAVTSVSAAAQAPESPRPTATKTSPPPVDSARIAAAFSSANAAGGSGPGSPTAPAPQPVLLSRADSLAIAQAVTARLEAERGESGERDRVVLDSMRFAYERAFSDSIRSAVAAIRGQAESAARLGDRVRIGTTRGERFVPLPPPRPDERRVVVLPFSSPSAGGRSATSGVGDVIADSIRAALAAAGTHSVVNEATTRDVAGISRVPTMIGAILHAPAVIIGQYDRRGDSLVVRVQVTCPGCGGMAVRDAVVPLAQAASAVPPLVAALTADLARVPWAQGRVRGTGRGTTDGQRPPDPRVLIPVPPPPPG